MECQKDIFDYLSDIATTVGGISIAIALYANWLVKRQLNFSVLDRCITIFQEKFTTVSKTSKEKELVLPYVDFVNSQLFYFQKKYIPKEVAHEWIDGMIDLIPIQDKSGTILNTPLILEKGLLNQYQRVKSAFTVNNNYNYELIYSDYENEAKSLKRKNERSRLVKEIYGNLMRNS